MTLYGFFSPSADKRTHAHYLNTRGEVVIVTCVCDDLEGREYKAKDKVYVGEVTKCVKSNSLSST